MQERTLAGSPACHDHEGHLAQRRSPNTKHTGSPVATIAQTSHQLQHTKPFTALAQESTHGGSRCSTWEWVEPAATNSSGVRTPLSLNWDTLEIVVTASTASLKTVCTACFMLSKAMLGFLMG